MSIFGTHARKIASEKSGAFERPADNDVGENENASPQIAPKPKPIDSDQLRRAGEVDAAIKLLNSAEETLEKQELQVRQSRAQLKGFKSFVRSAEIEFERANKLREIKGKLTAECSRLEGENSELRSKIDSLSSSLAAAKNRHKEMRTALEGARRELVTLIERDNQYRDDFEKLSAEYAQSDAERLRFKSANEQLTTEIEVMQTRLSDTQSELISSQRGMTQIEKEFAELGDRYEREKQQYDQVMSDLAMQRKAAEKYQTECTELRSQLEVMEQEGYAANKQAEDKLRITEDELYSLRTIISTLKSELRVKSQILVQNQDEVLLAKAEAKASKEEAQDYHERLVRARTQADQSQEQMARSNAEVVELSKKFDGVLAELREARSENDRLTRLLKIESRRKFEFVSHHAKAPTKAEELDVDVIALQNTNGTIKH